MIKISGKNYDDVPDILIRKGAFKKIKKAIDAVDGKVYDGYYYGHADVKNKLKAFSVHQATLQQGDKPKCYYCESYVEHVAVLQVEHFRPKAKVSLTDTSGSLHSGYNWLGLEWSNLLLSCPGCNNQVAKGNRFPLANHSNRCAPINPIIITRDANDRDTFNYDRVNCKADSTYLINESPLLVNPEMEEPSNFLTFDDLGHIIGRDDKGKKSVEIYNLDRDPLLAARQELITPILDEINVAIAANELKRSQGDAFIVWLESICDKVLKYDNEKKEYCLWGRYIIANFESCIVLKIDEEYRAQLRLAFQNIQNT